MTYREILESKKTAKAATTPAAAQDTAITPGTAGASQSGTLSAGGDLSAGNGPVAASAPSAADAFQKAIAASPVSLNGGSASAPVVWKPQAADQTAQAVPAAQATQGNDPWATGKDDNGDTDYSVLLKQAIDAGASAAEVQSLLDKRTQKALASYPQYAYDDTYSAAQAYIAEKSGQGQQRTAADYDLSEYLRKQKAAEIESTLAGLKDAYTKGLAEYDAQRDKLPETYQAARNDAAAQTAIAQRNFDERAAASGLNSGASGQAALDASAGYRGTLAQLNRQQANQAAEIDRAKAALTAQYETAIAQAQAEGDADLASALYQELVRVQELEKADSQTAYDRYMAEIERQAAAEDTAWTRSYNERVIQNQEEQQALENQRYEREYADAKAAEEYQRKLTAAELQAQVGIFSGYADLFGMDEATTNAMIASYAQQKHLTEQQAARDLADWYAQYGDLSLVEEMGVTPSVAYQAALTGNGAAQRSGGVLPGDTKNPSKSGGSAPEDIVEQAKDTILGGVQSGLAAIKKALTGSEGAGSRAAGNVELVLRDLGQAIREGKHPQDILDAIWDSGQYTAAEKQQILDYLKDQGYTANQEG